jgi:hypothetical protein
VATSNLTQAKKQQEFSLLPGKYVMAFRYYGPSQQMATPNVYIDGKLFASQVTLPMEKEAYEHILQTIKGKKTIFYFLLHYYVFFVLKHRQRLPESWIRQEFLPVGNPETYFLFDYFPSRSSIDVRCHPLLLDQMLVLLTFFNEASFPEEWIRIENETFQSAELNYSGAYLIRLIAKQHTPNPLPDMLSRISIFINNPEN